MVSPNLKGVHKIVEIGDYRLSKSLYIWPSDPPDGIICLGSWRFVLIE